VLKLENTASVINIILARLISARSNKEWLSVKDLFRFRGGTMNECTIRTCLRRLEQRGLIEKQLKRPYRALKGRRILHYQASKDAKLIHAEGGLPGSPRKRVLLVLQRRFSDLFDAGSVDLEQWQLQPVKIILDRFTSDRLRAVCGPAKRGDRAEQRVHSEEDFVVSISKLGKVTLNIRGLDWLGSLSDWFSGAGLSDQIVRDLFAKIHSAMKDAFTRLEFPCLDERVSRIRPQWQLRRIDPDTNQVTDVWELNYSGNHVGLEGSGQAEFVNNLAAALTAAVAKSDSETSKARKAKKDELPEWYK
jgi:hypothetical protein